MIRVALLLLISSISFSQDILNYVDPFIGTDEHGHTYPGATTPFGMVQLSPDNRVGGWDWCSGYHYSSKTIVGFSHTHISGTGVGDLGDILLMPSNGKVFTEKGHRKKPDEGYRSRFSHDSEVATPGYYKVTLDDTKIDVELTASQRAGFHKYNFKQQDSSWVILDLEHVIKSWHGENKVSHLEILDNNTVRGYKTSTGWALDQTIYFYLKFSEPIQNHELVAEKRGVHHNKTSASAKNAKGVFHFGKLNKPLLVKVGISSVDYWGAQQNLEKEIPHWDFQKTKKEAEDMWLAELSKVNVQSPSESLKRVYYTALYHSMLAPTIYEDVDGRYRGADLRIHESKGFTNYTIFSLWDTFRAEHPFFTITQPDRVADMVNSMLAHYEEYYLPMLPVWSFYSNETQTMIGNHAIPVISDALLKGIKGFDQAKAFEAVLSSSRYDIEGMGHYMEYGYVPIDKEVEAASKTLEYAYDDWCVMAMAQHLNKPNELTEFKKRSNSYKNIFDSKTNFMRARKSDGEFRAPFDPFYAKYKSDFTEGNSWQYSWFVPHDVAGLIELMGGKDEFENKLDSLFTITQKMNKEKPKDVTGLIGQYAHGNEPSHHVAYLYNYIGKPWKTQEKVHQIMTTLYDDTEAGICGNDDCGQTSSWYLFSALGMYPVNPSNGKYVLGKPLMDEGVINVGNGKTFKITAKNASKYKYVKAVYLNGKPLSKTYISHKQLMSGGELKFVMASKPNKKYGASPDAIPVSSEIIK